MLLLQSLSSKQRAIASQDCVFYWLQVHECCQSCIKMAQWRPVFSPHPTERRRGGADVSLQGGCSLGWRHDGCFSLLKSWQWSRSQPEGLRANSIPELSTRTPSRHHISEEARVYICLGFPADLLTALTMWLATESGGDSAGSSRRLFSRYLRNMNDWVQVGPLSLQWDKVKYFFLPLCKKEVLKHNIWK